MEESVSITKEQYDDALIKRKQKCKAHGGNLIEKDHGSWKCWECTKDEKLVEFHENDEIVIEPTIPDFPELDDVDDHYNRSPDSINPDQAVEPVTNKEDKEAAAIAEKNAKQLKKQKRSERKLLRLKKLQTYRERKAKNSKVDEDAAVSEELTETTKSSKEATPKELEGTPIYKSEDTLLPLLPIEVLKQERKNTLARIESLKKEKRVLSEDIKTMGEPTNRDIERKILNLQDKKDVKTDAIRMEFARLAHIEKQIGEIRAKSRTIKKKERQDRLKKLEEASEEEKAKAKAAEEEKAKAKAVEEEKAKAKAAEEEKAKARAARVVSPITEGDKQLASEDDEDSLDKKELDNLKKEIEIPELLLDRKQMRKDLVFEKARLKLKFYKMDVSNPLHEQIKQRIFRINDAFDEMKKTNNKGGRTRRMKKTKRRKNRKSTKR